MKTRIRFCVLLLAWFALPTFAPAPIQAAEPTTPYVRMRHKNDNGSPGPCLWWKERNVKMFVNERCSADVTRALCLEAVQKGLTVWNKQSCSDFEFTLMGAINQSTTGYDEARPGSNLNLIVWLESDWSSSRPRDPNSIALTTNTYDTHTGQIVDSDIELNGDLYQFTASDITVNVDIQATIAHESGHTLGLDHSPLPDSTMYFSASIGESKKRDLHPTDVQGLCAAYPKSQPSSNCLDSGGCSCSEQPNTRTSTMPWLPIGLLLVWFALQKRRAYPVHKIVRRILHP